jgi:ribosome-binding ATPase YchF (GTP1/OBG family)
VVETELMLADLESLEKRVPAAAKKATGGDKEAKIMASVLGQALELLREGKPARLTEPKDDEEARVFAQAQLLTAKPVLVRVQRRRGRGRERQRAQRPGLRQGQAEGAQAVVVSAAIEAELVAMEPAERTEYLRSSGSTRPG